ncbi:thioredoxin family protein [Fulvivirga kasyanovii]|uniref:Thioredoxin family protein n=1 Tax=Fulvivirga kasyanovii TaxID=396812 RepID=A0ABW9RZI8_9BACT|nr:thioredoxin family protein [Fulvivirga kasyanovii]MTI28789.1 thioredoxin family protein [Fulvivirga kasyanovii]
MLKLKLLSLLLFVVFFAGTKVNSGYQVGDTVKDFELKNVDGEMLALSDFEDEKGVILIFDCNTCPYSQAYLDRIKGLHANFKPKGYPVIAINPNDPGRSPGDSFDKMVAYAKENGYKHDYLQDEGQSVARAFGASNTPHVFVLKNEEGEFKVAYIGAIDNNTKDAAAADKKYVEDAVNALLEGKTPTTNKTKAIGCTIKWKEA